MHLCTQMRVYVLMQTHLPTLQSVTISLKLCLVLPVLVGREVPKLEGYVVACSMVTNVSRLEGNSRLWQ